MLNTSLSSEEYAAKVEQAIAILKHDLPTLFQSDISYDIYSQDIFFKDPVNTFNGKFNYRIIYWTLRFHGRLFFTELFFDLHDVHQESNTTIRADWTVRGTLRLPWKPKLLFNGFSIYSLNADALIHQHVDTWDRSPSAILQQFWQKS
ncbi:MAG: DUF2358 domain-containing protein [Leptolyngbyaceae cyanobacterium bins.302]|nr:DUF2358 domain-containing protein [Leptolyngbyaceae cyanobacterium bins.302]